MAEHTLIPRLLLITDRRLTSNLLPALVQAAEGGVDTILVREKDLDDHDFIHLCQAIQHAIRHTSTRILLSGRTHLVAHLGAAGVHLPEKNRPPLSQVRTRLGADKLIGCSCHDAISARQCFQEGSHYITLSPLFATPSHPDTQPLGLTTFSQILKNLQQPVLALGGINATNAPMAMAAGSHGIALIRGILDKRNPQTHAEKMASIVGSYQSSQEKTG